VTKANPNHIAQCRCGAVEVGAWSDPILVTACYCDDCQAASERLAASGNSGPLAGADGAQNLWCSAGTASPAYEARKTFRR
jgi:hypothetical protein